MPWLEELALWHWQCALLGAVLGGTGKETLIDVHSIQYSLVSIYLKSMFYMSCLYNIQFADFEPKQ